MQAKKKDIPETSDKPETQKSATQEKTTGIIQTIKRLFFNLNNIHHPADTTTMTKEERERTIIKERLLQNLRFQNNQMKEEIKKLKEQKALLLSSNKVKDTSKMFTDETRLAAINNLIQANQEQIEKNKQAENILNTK